MAEKLTAGLADTPLKVRFGNFEIVNDPDGRPLSLGKGTFGRTYQARHCYLDTIVALKIITERYVSDAAVRQRFLIEARAVAKLSHPHIARLYDFGEMDGVLHYAMEYCGGGSLADFVAKRGPLALRQVVEVGQQITGALKCAHTAGFVHRDLKPSNIMLTADEGPLFAKLIDFGLVQPSVPGATRSMSEDQSADGARFLGTPLFASPEQLREEPMDVRTDLFSLGITLWYLFIGGAPESGSSAAIAASRLSPESYAARLPANMPAPFRDVLLRLVEKDRNKRFGSAAEVFAAFNLCAAALGFRKAKDYTDPREQFSAWEDEEATQDASQPVAPEPIEIKQVDAELDSEFRIITRVNEDFTGLNYIAEARNAAAAEAEQLAILHVLHPMLLEDANAFEQLRLHVAKLAQFDATEIVRPEGITAYSDYTCVVLEKPKGTDLMSVLRTERTVHLIEAAPVLESIADACDRLCNAGLPGAHLVASRVFIEWPEDIEGGTGPLSKAKAKLYPRFLAVSEAPELAHLNEPEDVSSTMTTDMLSDPVRADNMPEHFGALLYRVVAGRNCPVAAALSSQAYVAIPGLSEHSNRLLALVIAKQYPNTSCGQVLREVLSAEGIVPRVPGHPTAGFTARGTGSTMGPPSATPQTGAPMATPAAPTATPARTWKAPSVTPAPVRIPSTAKPPPIPAPPSIPSAMPPPLPIMATPPPVPVAPKSVEALTTELKTSPPLPIEARAKETAPQIDAETATPPPIETRAKVPAPGDISKVTAPPFEQTKATTPPLTETRGKDSPPPIDISKTVATPPLAKIPSAAPATEEFKSKDFPRSIEASVPAAAPKPKDFSKAKESEATKAPEDLATKKPSVFSDPAEKAKVAAAKDVAVPSKKQAEKSEPKPSESKTQVPPAIPVAKVGAKTEKATPPPPPIVPLVPPPVPVTKFPDQTPDRRPPIWQDSKFRAAGIGIAALLMASLSYGAYKMFSHATAPSKPSVVAATPAPAPVPVVVATPVAAASVSKPESPRTVSPGRYAGQVRSKDGTGETMRELSIEPGLSSGYVIEYNTDPTKKVLLTSGRANKPGSFSGRAMFSSTSGTHSDETVTISPGTENGIEVTFQGRMGSGADYTLTGTFHPWTSDDQTQYEKVVADQNAQKQKAADDAKLAAERQAAEKTKAAQEALNQQLQKDNAPKTAAGPPQNTQKDNQPHTPAAGGEGTHRHQGGTQSTKTGSSTASSGHQSVSAPHAAPPPPSQGPAHNPPKSSKSSSSSSDRQPKPFSGTNPGG